MASGKRWSSEDRIKAAMWWVITGNSIDASKGCGIPARTIRDWTKEPWWDALLQEARVIKNNELDATWTNIIHTATSQLMDRIQNGEKRVFATGKEAIVPLAGKDLAWIIAMLSDKRALQRGQATARREVVSYDKQLKELDERLDKLGATEKKANG